MVLDNREVTEIRLVALEDAGALAELLQQNRDFLAPWEPIRPQDYFTVAGQQRAIQEALDQYARGSVVPYVILDGARLVGRVTLSNVIRGAFQSCNLGYWVGSAHNGRGFATRGVRQIVNVAFLELGLHRIEAGTLAHNVRSQRVLERNGFTRFGLAPKYLNIAGRWQDHAMYQLLNPDAT